MKYLMHNIFLYTLIIGLLMPNAAYAFKLVPMSVKMTPSGRGATESFVVDNSGAKPIAVEMKVFVRSMTEDGEDLLTEDEGDFVVFPSQMVIMPGESQAVRLQWLGQQDPEHELAYRLIAEQLPLDLDEEVIDGGRINVLFRYVASVYIVPKRRLQADVKITDAYIEEGEVNQLVVFAKNEGTKHSILRDARLTLKSSTDSFELGSDQLPGLSGANILVGHSRKFVLPAPAGSQVGALDAELQYYGQ